MSAEVRTVEPADKTILADDDLSMAYVRDDEAADSGDWGDDRWFAMDGGAEGPVHWDDLPECVRNGVRLVVADPGAADARVTVEWAAEFVNDDGSVMLRCDRALDPTAAQVRVDEETARGDKGAHVVRREVRDLPDGSRLIGPWVRVEPAAGVS